MYQVGQKVKVVKNLCGHGFRIGQKVKVGRLDSRGDIWNCRSLIFKREWCMSGEEVVPVKPIPREKPLKAICIIILSIIVIVAAVSVFLRDGGTISSNVSWTILGICYVVFFPTFATLIKIDNENAPDGNPRAHKKVSN